MRIRPDAVIAFYVLDAYPAVALKRLLRYSLFVVATGGDINLHQTRIHRLLRRIIYRESDKILAVSNDLRKKILEESGYQSILLPTGVNTSFFTRLDNRNALRKKWRLNDADIVILTVSNLEKHKGVDVAIQTLRLLQDGGIENATLMVVGTGSQMTTLRALARQIDLDKRVCFLGEVGRQDLLELYNLSNVFVLSSHSEGLPFSLLEAMACGVVCVSSPVGDIPTVIQDGHNGFLTNSIHPTDFAKKVRDVLSMNESGLAALTNNARRTVLEGYDLREIVQNLMTLVSQCRAES
jgi:glycosyltransferase involved in cell wall biosynthesis